MIPDSVQLSIETSSDDFLILPSKTYRLDFENKRIIGSIDEYEAVVQFIRKVLNTDKYAYEIYDWYYGNELLGLVGKDYNYIIAEIPRIAKEALLVDDRIIEVKNFKFTRESSDSVSSTFDVITMYGNYNMEVNV